jgi:hypothetical protein
MNGASTAAPPTTDAFASAIEKAVEMTRYLESRKALAATHSELEAFVKEEGRELLRRMLQGHHDLRALAERPIRVEGADRVLRTFRRPSERPVVSIVGRVDVARFAYQARGVDGLHPMDAALNLPPELYSLAVRREAAEAAAQGSFDEATAALRKLTGEPIGKRQVEELAARAAQDFDDFYKARALAAEPTSDLLVLTFDGKGVPMRREDLRPETRRAAESTPRRLRTRLTKGEKRHRKRMAEVAAVYTVAAYVRSPRDVLADLRPLRDVERDRERPKPTNKRVWAGISKSAEDVIRDAFDEARRRDPDNKRRWVVLLDGNRDQLRYVQKAARKVGASITIIVDLIHVLEYLWKAAYAFHADGSTEAEAWVQQRLLWLLQGGHAKVRANLRRNARDRGLEGAALKPITKCIRYLKGVGRYLAYDAALAAGLPIATGVIEGACRYLVKDRMEKTGARWSLAGAEAVLRLRALRTSGDFDAYWAFHLDREHARHHRDHYAANSPPSPIPSIKPLLRRVK